MTKLFDLKKNNLITGRASTAIYLILKQEKLENVDVLVPANVCYAAVYPVVFSGNMPIFCDTEKDGNLSLEIVKEYRTDNTHAVILPHMYGNVVKDIADISRWCKENNIVLIEDCASSDGATVDGINVGSFGDYAIHSFGYSKIVDLGNGGLLSSDKDLSIAETELEKLPLFTSQAENDETVFSKKYREYRNGNYLNCFSFVADCVTDLKGMFLYRLEGDKKDDIKRKINDESFLVDTYAKRMNNYSLYRNSLNEGIKKLEYHYNNGFMPWRYSLLIDGKERKELIDHMLKNSMPVSDWYPNVTEVFGDKISFSNVDHMEKRIVNFPLAESKERIIAICKTINGFYEEKI